MKTRTLRVIVVFDDGPALIQDIDPIGGMFNFPYADPTKPRIVRVIVGFNEPEAQAQECPCLPCLPPF